MVTCILLHCPVNPPAMSDSLGTTPKPPHLCRHLLCPWDGNDLKPTSNNVMRCSVPSESCRKTLHKEPGHYSQTSDMLTLKVLRRNGPTAWSNLENTSPTEDSQNRPYSSTGATRSSARSYRPFSMKFTHPLLSDPLTTPWTWAAPSTSDKGGPGKPSLHNPQL